MSHQAAELARRLARNAESVCRHYLPNGRRRGRYWLVGDVRNARGRTVCGNGEEAGGYNARTGNAWKSERNDAGVTTTETRRGGEAKTKNGKGVYKSSSGTTCVRTARNQGCR